MSSEPKMLSAELSGKFLEFLIQHSPSAFSRRLRRLLLDYIIHQQKIGFPLDFSTQVWELSDFFELLDCAVDELEGTKEN